MQFINIVVHSVENMNFRVHLQFEFTYLGLDKYLGVSNNYILGVSEHSMGSISQLNRQIIPRGDGTVETENRDTKKVIFVTRYSK